MISAVLRAALALLGLFLPALLPAQTLTLADGQVLLARVDDADGDGLRVTRLDNGGTLELTWNHLAADCATRIKQSRSLAAQDVDELTVQAQEVYYKVNGSDQTVIGRVVENDGTTIVVQNKGVQFRIPRKDLRGAGIRSVEVPVTQVFTQSEFYNARLLELQPGDDADKHVLFAEELLRVRDYASAKTHLELAKAKGNSKNPTRLAGLLDQTALFIEAKKERDLLDEIQVARQRGDRGDFDKGLKLIAQFEKDYPQSKLKVAFEAEKKAFAEARTRFLTQQVAEQWRRHVRYVAEKKVAEADVGIEAAKEYAQSKMGEDIAARLATQFKLPVEEIKQLFGMRARYPVGKRAELFAYGIGSWVLGDQAIIKGTKQGQAQQERAPKDAAQEREIQKIAKALRQALERKRAANQGQGGEDQEATQEDWWREATRTEKVGWLAAYYAENGGQMVVTIAFTQPCITCFGDGSVAEVATGGKMTRTKCFLCHGTRWLRTFKAY